MFSRFFNRKSDSSPEESEPIPAAIAAPDNDNDFEHVGNDATPSIPGLYPAFHGLGIQTQQSIDKGPQQSLMGVPFKLSTAVLSKNNNSIAALQFQIREIQMRMKSNLERPEQLSYEFNTERSFLQSI